MDRRNKTHVYRLIITSHAQPKCHTQLCLCIYLYIYIYVYIYIFVYVYVYIYICTSLCIWWWSVYVYVYAYIYVYVLVYVYVQGSVYVYANEKCMYGSMYVRLAPATSPPESSDLNVSHHLFDCLRNISWSVIALRAGRYIKFEFLVDATAENQSGISNFMYSMVSLHVCCLCPASRIPQ